MTTEETEILCRLKHLELAVARAAGVAKETRSPRDWVALSKATFDLVEFLAGGLPFSKREATAFVERGLQDFRARQIAVEQVN